MRPFTITLATVLATLSCLPAAAESEKVCPSDSVQVRNVRLFNECYCRNHDYPELAPVLRRLGLRLDRPGKSAWSEEARGNTWHYCSINLRWLDSARRLDPGACGKENRERIVGEIKQALAHPVAINTPFLSCR